MVSSTNTDLRLCSFCRPATEGSLDPYTPLIEVPDSIPKNASAAQDLPYYFAILQSIKPAEVREYEDACQALPLWYRNMLQLRSSHLLDKLQRWHGMNGGVRV